MTQPTPEQWWNTLDDENQAAYTAAADETFLTPDLTEKLTKAGVLVAIGGFGGEANAVFPGPYREYAAAQGRGASVD